MTHNNFLSAGQTPGIEIWRIEDFEPVPYPKKDYGKFHTGDSYIVLAPKSYIPQTRDRGRGTYSWDLHFWLGAETSQDEAGAAAMFAVQLDDHLGGAPVQYREVQDHESQLFLSHFPKGVRYAPGGIASGFTHIDRDAATEKRLFQVKGKKNVRVKEVPVGFSSLNNGDCFILDTGNDLVYVYVGAKSKRIERIKAIGAANVIRDQDHSGRADVLVIDDFCSPAELSDFFESLGGGSQDAVADEKSGGDDAAFEQSEEKTVTLYRVSDDGGSVKVTEVGQKPLQQDMLDNSDCFILDTGRAALYVWIGRGCSPQERSQAMPLAQKFITEHGYPSHTRVERVVAEAEPAAFREYFTSWNDDEDRIKRAFHCKTVADGRLVANLIYDCDQDDLEEDDTIIIDTGSHLYVWFGKDSDENERALSVKKAEKLQQFGNHEDVIPVEQGKEPGDFTKLFSKWNPNFWSTVQSYEQRRNACLR